MLCPSESERPLNTTVGVHQDLEFAWIYGISSLVDPNTKYHQFPSQFQLGFPTAVLFFFFKYFLNFFFLFCPVCLLWPKRRQSQETNQILAPSCSSAPRVWEPQKGEQNTNCTSNMDLVFPAFSLCLASSFSNTVPCILFMPLPDHSGIFCFLLESGLTHSKGVRGVRQFKMEEISLFIVICLFITILEKASSCCRGLSEALFAFGKMQGNSLSDLPQV